MSSLFLAHRHTFIMSYKVQETSKDSYSWEIWFTQRLLVNFHFVAVCPDVPSRRSVLRGCWRALGSAWVKAPSSAHLWPWHHQRSASLQTSRYHEPTPYCCPSHESDRHYFYLQGYDCNSVFKADKTEWIMMTFITWHLSLLLNTLLLLPSW